MIKGEIPKNYYGQERKLLQAGSETGRQENYTSRYTYPKEMSMYAEKRISKCI